MALPDRCKGCTHYDGVPGRLPERVCCHPDPNPNIFLILEGETCESFEQNYDM